jgi:glucan 1,3-beta-glucosidase
MGPCLEFLDAALEWGTELDLSVVLCFHAAVGFQSYDPPCGHSNENWDPSQFDVAANVEILRQVARRYGNHSALGAICILNEPHGDLPAETLNDFFKSGYAVMRDGEDLPESVQIMMPVFHHEFNHFAGRYTSQRGFVNVAFDVHCYQVFGDPYAGWSRMSLAQHLRYAAGKTSSHPAKGIIKHDERVVVTEFSLALPTWNGGMISRERKALTPTEKNLLYRSFALRQLHAFAKYTEGWFFWCWKDDSGPEWSFSESESRGWMPALSSNQMTGASSKMKGSSGCGSDTETTVPSSPTSFDSDMSDTSASPPGSPNITWAPAPTLLEDILLHGISEKASPSDDVARAKRQRTT